MEYVLICVLVVWVSTVTWICMRNADKVEYLKRSQTYQIDGWASSWQEKIDYMEASLTALRLRLGDLEKELPNQSQWKDLEVIRGGGPRPEVRNIETSDNGE